LALPAGLPHSSSRLCFSNWRRNAAAAFNNVALAQPLKPRESFRSTVAISQSCTAPPPIRAINSLDRSTYHRHIFERYRKVTPRLFALLDRYLRVKASAGLASNSVRSDCAQQLQALRYLPGRLPGIPVRVNHACKQCAAFPNQSRDDAERLMALVPALPAIPNNESATHLPSSKVAAPKRFGVGALTP